MTGPPVSSATAVRLAELLAVLSLGADLGMGQPMEHAMRQCLIALRLGKRLGLERDERASLADVLVISPKTASRHIEHIYAKIGVSNRARASLFAVTHGLMGEPAKMG